MNNRKYLWHAIVGAVFFSVMQPVYAADPPLPTPVGRVVWVKGELRAIMPNKEERILQKMSVIYLSDMLVTDAKSQAQIAFTDNTLLTFRPDTKFSIEQYAYKPQAKKGSVGKYVMNLIQGGFRTITGLIAKDNPSDYQVNTPVATIGVRGTDYTVVISKGELYVGFLKGTPCVKGKQNGEVCLSDKNKYAYVQSATSVPVPLSAQPAVLSEIPEIIPFRIDQFTSASSGSGPGAPRGPITNFCITQ